MGKVPVKNDVVVDSFGSREEKAGDKEGGMKQKKPFDPRTDNMFDIPDETEAINESMRNFKPPAEEMPNQS